MRTYQVRYSSVTFYSSNIHFIPYVGIKLEHFHCKIFDDIEKLDREFGIP